MRSNLQLGLFAILLAAGTLTVTGCVPSASSPEDDVTVDISKSDLAASGLNSATSEESISTAIDDLVSNRGESLCQMLEDSPTLAIPAVEDALALDIMADGRTRSQANQIVDRFVLRSTEVHCPQLLPRVQAGLPASE